MSMSVINWINADLSPIAQGLTLVVWSLTSVRADLVIMQARHRPVRSQFRLHVKSRDDRDRY